MPALRAYFFRPKNTKKIGPPVLQANRRLAFLGGKEGIIERFHGACTYLRKTRGENSLQLMTEK